MSFSSTSRRALSPLVLHLGLVVIALTSLGGCESEVPAPVAEDRLVEELMDEYIAARFTFYPVEATLAGLPGNDDRLGDFSRTDIEGRIRFLIDYRQKLTGVRPTWLSESAHMDLLWLTSLVKAELFELEERALWSRSPAFYGDAIREGIVSLLLSGDLAGRTGALAGRLDEVPDLVEDAKANLTSSSALWVEEGIASLNRSRALLSDLPLLLEPSLPSYRVADLAERSRAGVRALQSLIAVLTVRPVSPEVDYVLGDGRMEKLLLYREMIDRPLDELTAMANEAVTDETDALTELALEAYPGVSLRQLSNADTSDPIPAEEDEVRALADEVRAALGLREPVRVRRVPSTFLRDRVELWRPASLEPVKDPVLLLSDGEPPLGTSELRFLTLMELSSRLPQFEFQARAASLLRRVMASGISSEGFRSWRTGRRLAAGFENGDPRLFLHYRSRALLENVRLLAVLSIHGGAMNLAEAEGLFEERGLLSPRDARAEARRAALDPSVADAALGRLLFEELAHDYRRAFPLSADDEIVEKILTEGLVPLRLIRSKLLGPSDAQASETFSGTGTGGR